VAGPPRAAASCGYKRSCFMSPASIGCVFCCQSHVQERPGQPKSAARLEQSHGWERRPLITITRERERNTRTAIITAGACSVNGYNPAQIRRNPCGGPCHQSGSGAMRVPSATENEVCDETRGRRSGRRKPLATRWLRLAFRALRAAGQPDRILRTPATAPRAGMRTYATACTLDFERRGSAGDLETATRPLRVRSDCVDGGCCATGAGRCPRSAPAEDRSFNTCADKRSTWAGNEWTHTATVHGDVLDDGRAHERVLRRGHEVDAFGAGVHLRLARPSGTPSRSPTRRAVRARSPRRRDRGRDPRAIPRT